MNILTRLARHRRKRVAPRPSPFGEDRAPFDDPLWVRECEPTPPPDPETDAVLDRLLDLDEAVRDLLRGVDADPRRYRAPADAVRRLRELTGEGAPSEEH